MAAGTTITTVVTAATAASASAGAYDLTTLATLKADLGITDSTNDTVLQRYLTAASEAIKNYCNRVFQVETVTDEFWAQRDPYPSTFASGLAPLQLSRFPIKAAGVSSVVENGTTLVDATDFRVDYTLGHLTRIDGSAYPMRWPAYPISVTYQAGYVTIPAALVEAVIRLVRASWYARLRDPMLRQENIPGVREAQYWISSPADGGNLPPDVVGLIEPYVVPQIA